VECTIDNAFNLRDLVLQELVKILTIINCTLHLFKDQPEDGLKIGPKHGTAIII